MSAGTKGNEEAEQEKTKARVSYVGDLSKRAAANLVDVQSKRSLPGFLLAILAEAVFGVASI